MNTIKDGTSVIILAQEAVKNDDLKTLKKAIKFLNIIHDNYYNNYYHYVFSLYYKTLIKANDNDINAILDLIEMTSKNQILKEKALSYLEKAESYISNNKNVESKILYRLNDIYYKLNMFDKYDYSLSAAQNEKYFYDEIYIDSILDSAIRCAEKNNVYYIEKLIDKYRYVDEEKYLYYLQKLEKCIESIEDKPFLSGSAYKLYEEYYYPIEDNKKAKFYLEIAAKYEYKKAMLALSYELDIKEQESLLNKILSMPYEKYEIDIIGEARYALAKIYYKNEEYKDYKKALKLTEEGVKNKEYLSYNFMSKMYFEGKCVEQDYKQSKMYANLYMKNRIKKKGLEHISNMLAFE